MNNNEKLHHMLKMQDEFNCQVHPQWREQNYPFHIAIIDECAEALNHYGWKWWAKEKEPDIPMVKLELVDVWCFLISALKCKHSNEFIVKIVLDGLKEDKSSDWSFCLTLKELLRTVLVGKYATAHFYFLLSCATVGMDFDELYKLYLGKMALNKLRQDMGYKEGRYFKTWCCAFTDYLEVEDNHVMYTFCERIAAEDNRAFDYIYNKLHDIYKSHLEDD